MKPLGVGISLHTDRNGSSPGSMSRSGRHSGWSYRSCCRNFSSKPPSPGTRHGLQSSIVTVPLTITGLP